MPDYADDQWDCPNFHGGCEDVSHPGWQEFCPLCGDSRPSDGSNYQAGQHSYQTRSNDNDDTEDVYGLSTFLTQGYASAKPRAQTTKVFSPQSTVVAAGINFEEAMQQRPESTILGTHVIHSFKETAAALVVKLLISMECLEPPLKVGWTRVIVDCHTCGERFFDDIPQRPGGSIAHLKERMERSLKATITIVPSGEGEYSNTDRRLHLPSLIQNAGRRIFTIISWAKSPRAPELPLANAPNSIHESPASNSALGQALKFYIMSCVQRSWESEILLQDPVGDITTDRAFFAFLKWQVRRRRSRMMLILSCRRINEICFVKFVLRRNGLLEIRDHDRSCSNMCKCLPSSDPWEPEYGKYLYQPKPDFKDWPIVTPKTLAHLLKDPKMIDEDQSEIFSWTPKRRGGELIVPSGRQSVDGWGLHFKEGWCFSSIATLIAGVFLASFVFLICWSKYTSDVSAASGVSSYMITAATLAISLLLIKAGSM